MCVARQNPISQREIEICHRVREARLETSLSQVAFARLIGIDSSRLASYEHARVPIRAHLALAVAKISGVSLHWLANGIEPKKNALYVDKKLRDRIPENQLFSEAFDAVLMPLIEHQIAEAKKNTGGKLDTEKFSAVGDVGPDDVVNLINQQLRKIAWETPPHLFQELYSLVYWAMWNFRHNNASLIEKFSGVSEAQKTSAGEIAYQGLTDVSTIGNIPGVKEKLPALLKRLNEATKERGAKTALAKFMDVKLPKVSQWLSGTHKPSGETTLQLLHWVEQQERQN